MGDLLGGVAIVQHRIDEVEAVLGDVVKISARLDAAQKVIRASIADKVSGTNYTELLRRLESAEKTLEQAHEPPAYGDEAQAIGVTSRRATSASAKHRYPHRIKAS